MNTHNGHIAVPVIPKIPMHYIAQAILNTPVNIWYKECLKPIISIHGVPPFIVEATLLNLRHTYHCYACRVIGSRKSFLVISQAYIDGFYSPSTGLLFRHPKCYLAQAHDIKELAMEAAAINSSLFDINQRENKPATVLSGSQSHLAHYLWNHLSALYRFLDYAMLKSHRIEEILISKNSELFGSLTSIFPNLSNLPVKIVESIESSHGGEIRLEHKIILEPYENSFVPTHLSNTIARFSSQAFNCSEIISSSSRVIAYGIRIGNRRPINRHQIFIMFLQSSLKEFGSSLLIIVDVSSQMFGSKGVVPLSREESLAAVKELREIASAISSDIRIFSLIETPIHQTISTLKHSIFGIYEWGANLAWFSWILRKPVLALCPPSVRTRLIESQQLISCWGSYFWEADVPTPLLPISMDIDSEPDATVQLHRLSPEDYIIDINSFKMLLDASINRARNFSK